MLNVQVTKHVSTKSVPIPARSTNLVLPMQNVKSTTPCHWELWPVSVYQDLLEREMWNVPKLVRFHLIFLNTRQKLIVVPSIQTVIPVQVGCTNDDQCPATQACRNSQCVNPCTSENPCSSSAYCSVENHQPSCDCPLGTTGDPYRKCISSKRKFSNVKYSVL